MSFWSGGMCSSCGSWREKRSGKQGHQREDSVSSRGEEKVHEPVWLMAELWRETCRVRLKGVESLGS